MSYFPKPSLNENDLAIIERGDAAAHSIEAGQYVSWHGKTGKAKAAILQGATLDDTLFDYDEDGVLNASLKPWTLLTNISISVGSSASLPSKWEELRVVFEVDDAVSGKSIYSIEKSFINNIGNKWRAGSANSGIAFTITESTITMDNYYSTVLKGRVYIYYR